MRLQIPISATFSLTVIIMFSEKNLKIHPEVLAKVINPDIKGKDLNEPDEWYRAYATIPLQTHSTNVAIVTSESDDFPETDALITFIPNLTIGIKTADCVPILIYASDIKGIAAIHAGWKGSLNGIVEKTVNLLIEQGASPTNMFVTFGPSISKKNYEVDQTLADKFIDAGFSDYVNYPLGKEQKPHLDLQGINMERLLQRGVKTDNIYLNPDCTYATTDNNGEYLYQSYRRDGEKAGRILTTIKIRSCNS